jgi:hypothetical protein
VSLERERRLEGLTEDEVGAYYARGQGAQRITEIERMRSVPQRIEMAYRGALGAAKIMRGLRRAADFENLKIK